ncbi:hypothetical protein CAEBREN_22218 [Caenorhabditis brenneri]|uniref:Uncharacterized protein n=1 Tax=Caenorhabditis brenneri TaxID=135651 RepID=G0N0X5_CAEBE|nr:hypothetical protein CAEBREN_22218 [Caenorhabditis brenneri]
MSTTHSNYTSLIEDIEGLATNSSHGTLDDSVYLATDYPFPQPADPFEGYVNGSDYTIVEVTNQNGTETIRIFEYLSLNPWLIYTLCGVALLIVIVAIVGLIVWLKNHKACCTSCCKSKPKISMEARQNSSSNLESYGRPALPRSAYHNERPKSQESYIVDPSNLAISIDGIETIPHFDVPREQHRELPKRSRQYQMRD